MLITRHAALSTKADMKIGDMYFMGLSATRFLKHWPEMQKQYDNISLRNAWIETFKHDGQQMLKPQKVADRLHAQGLDPGSAPGAFQMRPLVYKMLLEQVEKCGITIDFGKRVVDYFESPKQGGVKLEDGTKLTADIVVAADGIGSKSQTCWWSGESKVIRPSDVESCLPGGRARTEPQSPRLLQAAE